MSYNVFAERQRENTEWDVTYWYNANQNTLPRILLVGDSITKGYESFVRDELAGSAYLSYYATSKCVTDRSFLKALTFVLEEYDYKVIHFNNGLHSLFSDSKEWELCLHKAFKLIREKAPETKIIWCSSTPLKKADLTEKAKLLNSIALNVIKSGGYDVEVSDLFAAMDPLDRAREWVDTYHFSDAARKTQGQIVATMIRNALGVAKASESAAEEALKNAESETGPDGKISTSSNTGN